MKINYLKSVLTLILTCKAICWSPVSSLYGIILSCKDESLSEEISLIFPIFPEDIKSGKSVEFPLKETPEWGIEIVWWNWLLENDTEEIDKDKVGVDVEIDDEEGRSDDEITWSCCIVVGVWGCEFT